MLKTKTWILIFSVVLVICLAATAFLYLHSSNSSTVTILQDGKIIREIDLSAVKNPYSFVVNDPNGGSNTILVEPGRICVKDADCPDLVCVHRGWLSDSSAPIVCIPHRLVIQIGGDSPVDTVVK